MKENDIREILYKRQLELEKHLREDFTFDYEYTTTKARIEEIKYLRILMGI